MNKNELNQLEEGKKLNLDFSKLFTIIKNKNYVIPVAVQNSDTKEVILIAYTNQEAFEHTIKTKTATFWSTTRNELWIKGNRSGNTFKIQKIFINCEQNSLVYVVKPEGEGICHTYNKDGKARNCYYRSINLESLELKNLDP